MKTRAAVAFEAGKPLEIVEVDLEGPKGLFHHMFALWESKTQHFSQNIIQFHQESVFFKRIYTFGIKS